MVGNRVSVARICCGAGFNPLLDNKGAVGLAKEGWNGVGVGEALGAAVMITKGCGAWARVGDPQDENRTARQSAHAKRLDVFINVL